ncbi:MAG TPA: flagellar hook-length control protein FliK, partial [Janthinobacterium sp.]|nr:flagellar hook-length control protein FliK [Janthinobacterium sp.]
MLPQVGTRQTGANIGPVNPTAAAPDGASAARQTAFQSSLQNLVGQSMQGEVLAKLTDGSSLVKVAGSSVRMMLPAEAEVGSEVAMTLVAAYPRPTFQIGDNGRPGAPAQLVYPEADGGETASATTQIGARAAAAA